MSKATFKRNLNKRAAEIAKEDRRSRAFSDVFPKLNNSMKAAREKRITDALIAEMLAEVDNA